MSKQLRFYNLSKDDMTFSEVYKHIESFIAAEPRGRYRLMIGTDSQTHSRSTRFITGVVIRREGRGVWACVRKKEVRRVIVNLHEKMSMETHLTEEVAQLFTAAKKQRLVQLILPHIKEGSSFTFEGHLDVGNGTRNKTKVYVEEMMERLTMHGMKARVKPDSFVASSYANKYTK
ncbi:ribonuclease H-like YkuK family protein [Alteribacillus sp. HJP-4]|uniref:ribonuclease H-like YkuK family protein n=1 Tax=Alteribacillus sp. HJP-4 TaxID=2775394 RepID=UPI0035CD2916